MRSTRVSALAAAVLLGACGGGAVVAVPASFGTRDGFQLAGEEFGQGPKGVVLVHGEDGDRRSWSGFARELAAKGFHVLTFDLRGYGSSQGERAAARSDRDVVAAVEHLATRGASRPVLVGASLGGLSCLKAATSRMALAGVATLSAPPEPEGLTIGNDIALVTAPKLYLVSAGDTGGSAEGELLLRVSPEPRNLITYPGSARGVDLLKDGKARSDLVAFVAGALP